METFLRKTGLGSYGGMGGREGEEKWDQEKLLTAQRCLGQASADGAEQRERDHAALALGIRSECQHWGPRCCSFGSCGCRWPSKKCPPDRHHGSAGPWSSASKRHQFGILNSICDYFHLSDYGFVFSLAFEYTLSSKLGRQKHLFALWTERSFANIRDSDQLSCWQVVAWPRSRNWAAFHGLQPRLAQLAHGVRFHSLSCCRDPSAKPNNINTSVWFCTATDQRNCCCSLCLTFNSPYHVFNCPS